MTWRRMQCWALVCDVCLDGWNGDQGQPHFATRAAGLEVAKRAGWVIAGYRAVCPECTESQLCGIAGHQWGEWLPAGPFPRRDGGTWRGKVRHCRECSCADWSPSVGKGERNLDQAG